LEQAGPIQGNEQGGVRQTLSERKEGETIETDGLWAGHVGADSGGGGKGSKRCSGGGVTNELLAKNELPGKSFGRTWKKNEFFPWAGSKLRERGEARQRGNPLLMQYGEKKRSKRKKNVGGGLIKRREVTGGA